MLPKPGLNSRMIKSVSLTGATPFYKVSVILLVICFDQDFISVGTETNTILPFTTCFFILGVLEWLATVELVCHHYGHPLDMCLI